MTSKVIQGQKRGSDPELEPEQVKILKTAPRSWVRAFLEEFEAESREPVKKSTGSTTLDGSDLIISLGIVLMNNFCPCLSFFTISILLNANLFLWRNFNSPYDVYTSFPLPYLLNHDCSSYYIIIQNILLSDIKYMISIKNYIRCNKNIYKEQMKTHNNIYRLLYCSKSLSILNIS